ncbi:MAG: hypothetical protein ACLQVK_03350 [Acidimicrobiales bacterium]
MADEADWLDRIQAVADNQEKAKQEAARQAREEGDRRAARFDRFTETFRDVIIPALRTLRGDLATRGFDLQIWQPQLSLDEDGPRLEQSLTVSGHSKTGSGRLELTATRIGGGVVTLTTKTDDGDPQKYIIGTLDPDAVTVDFLKDCLEIVITSYLAGDLNGNVRAVLRHDGAPWDRNSDTPGRVGSGLQTGRQPSTPHHTPAHFSTH